MTMAEPVARWEMKMNIDCKRVIYQTVLTINTFGKHKKLWILCVGSKRIEFGSIVKEASNN
jgi:hypothetical protein